MKAAIVALAALGLVLSQEAAGGAHAPASMPIAHVNRGTSQADVPDVHAPRFILLDASTGGMTASQWDNVDRRIPLGSIVKPFTALAYAATNGYEYPTEECRGADDHCWLPAGHGRLGLVDAVAQSCNAYFAALARQVSSTAFQQTLRRFGVIGPTAALTERDLVGLGDRVPLAPVEVLHAYVELTRRREEPGVEPILRGLHASATSGTAKAVGATVSGNALTKTGTAPCIHSPRADADGYAVVLYPADQPRIALMVQAHGRTGADTATLAAGILHDRVLAR